MTAEADPDVLDAKAATVERAFEVLDEIEEEGIDAIREDLRTSFATRRALQEAAEAALDVAGHVVVRSGYRNAEDYADLFTVLEEEDVLPEDLARRLEEMLGSGTSSSTGTPRSSPRRCGRTSPTTARTSRRSSTPCTRPWRRTPDGARGPEPPAGSGPVAHLHVDPG